MNRVAAINLIAQEFRSASERFPPMQSAHEGYAVILEELEELWAEIKDDKRSPELRHERMRHEAVQVAAMAMRFVVDIHLPVRVAPRSAT